MKTWNQGSGVISGIIRMECKYSLWNPNFVRTWWWQRRAWFASTEIADMDRRVSNLSENRK
jgi:hypothetical protein